MLVLVAVEPVAQAQAAVALRRQPRGRAADLRVVVRVDRDGHVLDRVPARRRRDASFVAHPSVVGVAHVEEQDVGLVLADLVDDALPVVREAVRAAAVEP